jgi:transposase InsO family protein
VVIDLFARRVIGWAVSDRLHKQLALEALGKALAICGDRKPDSTHCMLQPIIDSMN